MTAWRRLVDMMSHRAAEIDADRSSKGRQLAALERQVEASTATAYLDKRNSRGRLDAYRRIHLPR